MIQKTTYRKAKSKFNMPEVVGRIKKRFRKKLKKTVQKSKIREVWRDYVDIMIIEPLIEKGKVQIDKRFSLEIVGKPITEDKRKVRLLTQGLIATKAGVKQVGKLNQTRKDFTYRIVMTESRFKEGVLMYDADPRIRKAVTDALCNTSKYYRIISNVNK